MTALTPALRALLATVYANQAVDPLTAAAIDLLTYHTKGSTPAEHEHLLALGLIRPSGRECGCCGDLTDAGKALLEWHRS